MIYSGGYIRSVLKLYSIGMNRNSLILKERVVEKCSRFIARYLDSVRFTI